MIAKGNLHAHGSKLAAYLTAGKDGERAELVELRGFVADNIRDAFIDVQIQAEATRATKPFFHAYVRLPEGEGLARDQWQHIANRIEQRLGFEGQPRAVAFHHGPEGSHMHVAWARIDLEDMKAIDPGLYKNKLKEVCREMERELDLTRVRNDREPNDKARAADRDEFEQSRRLGTNLKEIRGAIRDCWDQSDSGKAFAVALDEQGLILARGDRRDFVVVDRAGGDHALGKRITGATGAETRARLSDLDLRDLPTVDAARAQQRAQHQVDASPQPLKRGAADNSIDWTDRAGMVAQQQSAMKAVSDLAAKRALPLASVQGAAVGPTEGTDGRAERLARLQKMFAPKKHDDKQFDPDSHSQSRGGRGRTR